MTTARIQSAGIERQQRYYMLRSRKSEKDRTFLNHLRNTHADATIKSFFLTVMLKFTYIFFSMQSNEKYPVNFNFKTTSILFVKEEFSSNLYDF